LGLVVLVVLLLVEVALMVLVMEHPDLRLFSVQ
jgi:hypothetical protein